MSTKKKQHFVPQLHLTRFTYDGELLHVYDKFTRRQFIKNKRDVAEENAFYNIPSELLTGDITENGIYPQMMEDLLSKLEGRYQKTLQNLLDTPPTGTIHDEVKGEMCYFLSLQILRTRDTRNLAREMQRAFLQSLVDELVKLNFPDHTGLTPRAEITNDVISHLRLMLDPRIVAPICEMLGKHIWCLAFNDNPKTLYTSDTPVVKWNYIDHKYASGWAGPGVEIVFPITPRHALILLERQMFSQYLKIDRHWVEMEANDVDHCNELQVVNSHRQIFSLTGDFQFIEDMYKSRPDLFAPRDDRVTVNVYDKPNDERGKIKQDVELLIKPRR